MSTTTKTPTRLPVLPFEIIEQIINDLLRDTYRELKYMTIAPCMCRSLHWIHYRQGLQQVLGVEWSYRHRGTPQNKHPHSRIKLFTWPYRGTFFKQIFSIVRASRAFFPLVSRFLRTAVDDYLELEGVADWTDHGRGSRLSRGTHFYVEDKENGKGELDIGAHYCFYYSYESLREVLWELKETINAVDTYSVGTLEYKEYDIWQLNLPSRSTLWTRGRCLRCGELRHECADFSLGDFTMLRKAS